MGICHNSVIIITVDAILKKCSLEPMNHFFFSIRQLFKIFFFLMKLLRFEISQQSFIFNPIFYANNFGSPVKTLSIPI